MRRRVFFAVFSFSMALPKGEALDIPQGLPSSTKGSPFGRAGAKRLRGQARHERTAHAAISRLFVRAILSLRPRITVSILALSVTFGDTSPRGRGFRYSAGPSLFDERLSLWESWREAPERASPARKDRPCSDKQALCQSDTIAAPSNHRQHPCPLRHLR